MKKILSFLFVLFVAVAVSAQTPNVVTTIDSVTPTKIFASFVKNEACTNYSVYISTEEEMVYYTSMFQCTEEVIVQQWGAPYSVNATHTFTDLEAGTEYKLYVLASSAGLDTMLITTVSTASTGGTGTSIITLAVSNITSTSATVTYSPNEETALYKNLVITQDYFNEIGADSVISMLKEDYYVFYEAYDWTWASLSPNTAYYAVAIGQNSVGTWGDLAQYPFSTLATSIADFQSAEFDMYPNPASTSVKLENVPAASYLQICDVQGNVVLEQSLNDSTEMVSLRNLAKGMYIVIITDAESHQMMTKKLIVR